MRTPRRAAAARARRPALPERPRAARPRLVVLTRRDGIATLALPEPRVDLALAQALVEAAETIAHDETIRVALLHGPPGLFCLGSEHAAPEWPDWVAALGALAVPVIAAVGGAAVAEGAELSLAADIRIVAPRAWFAFPHLTSGSLPRHGATQRLPRLVGRTRALELLLSGRRIGAREAQRIGLATLIAAPPLIAARALAAELCTKGPIALRLAKEAVGRSLDLTLEQGVRLEQDLYVLLQTTADRATGVRAFVAKRQPKFKGR
ncbi:MAG: enoyl-CoA hydratase-related protein [bacterium]